jgi:hypothetical protein
MFGNPFALEGLPTALAVKDSREAIQQFVIRRDALLRVIFTNVKEKVPEFLVHLGAVYAGPHGTPGRRVLSSLRSGGCL